MMAADAPLGATVHDTAEYMLGRVLVTPVFLDSNGVEQTKTEFWDEGEIDEVLDKIAEGLNWWTNALAAQTDVHELEFIIDRTYADNPFPVDFEPISNRSNRHEEYVDDFLDHAGIDSSLGYHDAVRTFNDSQRRRDEYAADWAFSIFVVDSSNDVDDFFPNTGSFRGAFAYPGGRYIVMPSERPASTVAHELGHIFWAFDEYANGDSYDESRGYYNTPNTNAHNNPDPDFEQELSIMGNFNDLPVAYLGTESPASTFAHVGWQDSDGDGIFDVLDVPLHLSGSGSFDPLTSTYRFQGEASAVPLINQNTVGRQSDITLNRVSRIEYRIDDGDWSTIVAPDTSAVSFDLQFVVPETFTTIEIRALDARIGITSPTLTATRENPMLRPASLSGFAYFDDGLDDSSRSLSETLAPGTTIVVTPSGEATLAAGQVQASEQTVNDILQPQAGIAFMSASPTTSDRVTVLLDSTLDNLALFAVEDQQRGRYITDLDHRTSLAFALDEPASYVEIDVVGLSSLDDAAARIEAFDMDGNLISRMTTDQSNNNDGQLALGETQTLWLGDAESRIASVQISGHNQTRIGVTAIRHGVDLTLTTGQDGTFALPYLPSGEYIVTPQSTSVIHSFDPQAITIDASTTNALTLAARRVDSPRYNAALAEDVNGDGDVSALDALLVINDLNNNDARSLTWDETEGFLIDVTNDGVISALDALRVINRLNEDSQTGQSEPAAEDPHGDSSSMLVAGEHIPQSASGSSDDDRLSAQDQAISELTRVAGDLGVETKAKGFA